MCFPLLLNFHTVCVFSAVFGSRIQMHSLFCAYSAEMLPCIRSSRLRAISKPRPVREKALPHSSCAQSFFAAYEQPVPNSMLTPFMNVYTIWASSTPAKLFGSLSKIFNICICSLFCICFMYPFYEYTKSKGFCIRDSFMHFAVLLLNGRIYMESHSPYVPVPAHLFCIHSRIVYPHIRFLHDMLYDRVEDADRHLFIYLYSLFSASHHSIGNHRFLSV